MSTLKVEVLPIEDVQTHPNADALEIASIKGWQCVVRKDSFKKGDLCVYFPIDSVLPNTLEATIFGSDSKVKLHHSRVKTIKLRGAISQGLAVPPSLIGVLNPKIHLDLTSTLGVTKYEPPVKASPQRNCLGVSKKQSNPHFKKYTSIENLKNYPCLFEQGELVHITEKIHGTNFRAGWVRTHAGTWLKKVLKFFGLLPEWEFVYGSHNVQLQSRPYNGFYEKNVYSEAVINYGLEKALRRGEVVYGEIYGDGIQKGYNYGCPPGVRKLVIFDVLRGGSYLPHDAVVSFCSDEMLPVVPTLYTGPFCLDKAKELASGGSVLYPEEKIKEGVVVRPFSESTTYMGRKILKLINDDYLLKDQTEFH